MIGEQSTDEHLIRAVLHGNTDYFEIIVRRYQKKIYSVGMRFFHNDEDARDFTQEVFVKAFSALESYRESAPFKFWLLRIAYNHGINSIKKLRVDDTLDGDYLPARDMQVEHPHVKGEILALLEAELAKLPDEYRLCVDMYFFWGMPHKDISNITGLPVNTIKSHVFRAKQMLYKSLKGTIAEEYHEL